jgi:hypothetical protein
VEFDVISLRHLISSRRIAIKMLRRPRSQYAISHLITVRKMGAGHDHGRIARVGETIIVRELIKQLAGYGVGLQS